MKKLSKKKKAAVIVLLCVVLALAAGLGVWCRHPFWKLESRTYLPASDNENVEITGGEGSYESPYNIENAPEMYVLHIPDMPWDDNDTAWEKVNISRESGEISKLYTETYGYDFELKQKFVKGTPRTYTYKIYGAPGGEAFVITVDCTGETPEISYTEEK